MYLFLIKRWFLVDIYVHLDYGKVQPNVSPTHVESRIIIFTLDTITGELIISAVNRQYLCSSGANHRHQVSDKIHHGWEK